MPLSHLELTYSIKISTIFQIHDKAVQKNYLLCNIPYTKFPFDVLKEITKSGNLENVYVIILCIDELILLYANSFSNHSCYYITNIYVFITKPNQRIQQLVAKCIKTIFYGNFKEIQLLIMRTIRFFTPIAPIKKLFTGNV